MLINEMEIPEYINLENFKEVLQNKLSKRLDEIAGKDKWHRGIESNEIHSYRKSPIDGNNIIGLMIFQDNAPKEECVKCFVLKTA